LTNTFSSDKNVSNILFNINIKLKNNIKSDGFIKNEGLAMIAKRTLSILGLMGLLVSIMYPIEEITSTDSALLRLLAKSITQQEEILSYLSQLLYQNSSGKNSGQASAITEVQWSPPDPQFNMKRVKDIIEKTAPEVQKVVNSIIERECRANEDSYPVRNEEYIRIVFTGPPGTAKTTLAEALTLMLNRKFKLIFPVSAMNKYQFCLQQYIDEQIKPLIELDEPCVIVIDEIDQLHALTNKDEGVDPVLTLCHCMDECERKDRGRVSPHFIFLATTNHVDKIPPELKSRLRIVEVKCPDRLLRIEILFDLLFENNGVDLSQECDLDFINHLAKKTDGLSIRDLKTIVNVAIEEALAEAYEHRQRGDEVSRLCLEKKHLTEAYKNVWKDTDAAERYWRNRLGRFITGNLKNYAGRLLIITLESSIHCSINRVFTIPDRRRDEERYQEQNRYTYLKRLGEVTISSLIGAAIYNFFTRAKDNKK